MGDNFVSLGGFAACTRFAALVVVFTMVWLFDWVLFAIAAWVAAGLLGRACCMLAAWISVALFGRVCCSRMADRIVGGLLVRALCLFDAVDMVKIGLLSRTRFTGLSVAWWLLSTPAKELHSESELLEESLHCDFSLPLQ